MIQGETAEQLCALVAAHLGLPANEPYRLVSSDGRQLVGDIFKQVNNGDTLTVAHEEKGGGTTCVAAWVPIVTDGPCR